MIQNNFIINIRNKSDVVFDQIKKDLLKNKIEIELLGNIYSGNNGNIYKFKFNQKNNLKTYVIKSIREKNKINKRKKILFPPEVSIHQRLKHNNIIPLLGYYNLPSYSSLIFEYMKYGDLVNFQTLVLKKKILSESLLCYLASQISEALYYIHKNKIIHMDIKHKNMLINDYLQVKLIDFSISLDYKNNKKYIQLPKIGTFGYMSPEVLNCEKIDIKDASKIDIFSFGVLLYCSAFGILPYDIGNIHDKDCDKILENIQNNELIFPEEIEISKKFKSFLSKCLDKNIEKRYNIYNLINDDWIKGSNIIKEYKDNLCNTNIFLIDLISNNILNFNRYIEN